MRGRPARWDAARRWSGRIAPFALLAAAAAVALAAGGGDDPVAVLADGQRLTVAVHLVEEPRPGPFGWSVEVVVAEGPHAGVRLLARLPRDAGFDFDELPGSGRADAAAAWQGAEARLDGRFDAVRGGQGGPAAAPVPRRFDLAGHLRAHGIAGELHVDRAVATGSRRGGWRGTVDGIRARALDAIGAGLPADRAALARGMVLGADDDLPPTVREDFRASGLAHLTAASGQNVMLLVALAVPALAALGLGGRARLVALLTLIALYVPLAGAEAPIQRAGVMAAAGLVATLAARPASRWYALALAAAATLAANPQAWRQPGWQLSFAAVAGILVAAGPIRRRLGGLPVALAEGVALTVAATAATAPLVALHFGEVSAVSLPANVAALALVAPIMWLGTLRGALAQLASGDLAPPASWADALLVAALGPLLAGMARIAALFADLPGATARVAIGGPLELALAYVAIATVALALRHLVDRGADRRTVAVARLRRLPRGRRVALAGCMAAALALGAAHTLGPDPPPATLTVSFLDVGQGDATLVQHPDGSAVLFDGGPPEGGVLGLLRRAGVRRLSALVLTHASRDHHGGLLEVVRALPVDLVLDGGDGTRDRSYRAVLGAVRARGTPVRAALAPLAVTAGGVTIDVLSPRPRPPGPPPEDPNPRAVVAVVAADGFRLLLSGDAESDALAPLALPRVDAIKAPHHGSADPGLPEILATLRPSVAAIPVGPNSYGHPAPSTVAALRRAGVATWRTDLHGTIRLAVERGRLTVDPERGDAVAVGP